MLIDVDLEVNLERIWATVGSNPTINSKYL